MDNFIPAYLSTIQIDSNVGCDLYIQNRIDGKIHYVLYCRRDKAIESRNIFELLNKDITTLYIKKAEQKTYLKYAEINLKHIIKKKNIDANVKAEMVYTVAKNIMIDIFESSFSREALSRSRMWVSNVVDFALNNENVLSTIVNLISYDYTTYSHSVNVSIYGLLFAKYLGIERNALSPLTTGFLMHDIGKIQTDPEIINKKGRLSEEEFEKIKKHVEVGVKILTQEGCAEDLVIIPVIQHHEKCNGKGYPLGLKDESIHKYGKIASILDVYDALTTRRSYSDAKKPFSALTLMEREMRGSFDMELFKKFVLFLGTGGIK